jgi:hypothetical protein
MTALWGGRQSCRDIQKEKKADDVQVNKIPQESMHLQWEHHEEINQPKPETRRQK